MENATELNFNWQNDNSFSLNSHFAYFGRLDKYVR